MPIVFEFRPPAVDAGLIVHGLVKVAETAGAEALLAATEPDVPYDTGELQASGHIEHDGHGAAVVFSAVAEDGYDYAAIQHEREDYHHERGKSHYLLDQMHQANAAIVAAMAATIRV